MPSVVTDPQLLARLQELGGVDAGNEAPAPAVRTKPVTDNALIDKLNRLSGNGPETAPEPPKHDEADTLPAALDWARSAASGDAVATLPSLTGVRGAQALEEARRTRGQSPELRHVDESTTQGILQFGTNVLADAVGIVASKAALPVEAAVVGGKVAGKLAGGLTADAAGLAQRAGADSIADWLVGKTAAKAIAKQQQRGEYATGRAAGEIAGLAGETARGIAFGMNPAAFEAAQRYRQTGDAGQAAEAGWEAFKSYPLASLLPGIGIGREATKAGGVPIVRDGMEVQTVKGKPVLLNKAGKVAFEPFTAASEALGDAPQSRAGQWAKRKAVEAEATVQPVWQRLAYDVVPNDIVKAQRAQAAAVKAGLKPSPAVEGIADVVGRHEALRDIDAELSASQFGDASPSQKFAAVEGTLPGAEQVVSAPVSLSGDTRDVAQQLGQMLVQSGMDEATARDAVPFVLFEGVQATKRGHLPDPTSALSELTNRLNGLSQADRIVEVQRLGDLVRQQMADPTFLAAADQAWSMPHGGYKWVPGSEVRQRDGYLAALKAARQADEAAGRKVFNLDSPDLGQLQRDYTASLYNKLVDDTVSTPDGRLRLMEVLRSKPVSRLQANPSAPPHVQALAAWSNSSPARRKFVDAINKASLEIADNLGVDPVVIAKNFDRYLSRAFTEHIDAQAKLAEKLGLLEDSRPYGIGQGVGQTGRYKRKLSQQSAGSRLEAMIEDGVVDLNAALAGTADQMMATTQLLYRMNEWHNELAAAGMVSDTPKPGWVYTGDRKAAPAKSAASGDPYNFMFGKLADKYVHPQVAKQLGITKQVMPKAWAVMQLWRLMHTSLNLPIYPLRNFAQDHGFISAATGLDPTHGTGRKLRLESAGDIDRYVADKVAGRPATVSPVMLEAIEQGVVDMNQTIADLQELPQPLRSPVFDKAKQIAGGALKETDPASAAQFVADAALALKAGMKLPVEAVRAVMSANDAARGVDKLRDRPSVWLQRLNAEIARSTVITMMSVAEQTRRLYAFRAAREHLGLSPERAALFAQHAAYGIEQPSVGMERALKSPAGQILLPPFLRFGAWQAKTYAQRALNDPKLHMAWALTQGLSAANEEDILRQYGRGPLNARLAQAFLQRNSAPDVGLSNASDIADVVRPFAPRLADNLARRSNFLTVSLRDVGGYSSFLSNMDPSLSGIGAVVQFNPLARLGGTLLSTTLEDPISGIPRLQEGDPSIGRKAIAYTEMLSSALFPQHMFTGMGEALSVVKSLASGEPVATDKSGKVANVANLSKYALGPLGMTAIDQVALANQLAKRIKAERAKVGANAAKFTAAVPVVVEPEQRQRTITSQAINAAAKQKQIELSVAVAYGGDPIEVKAARQIVEQARQRALKAIGTGDDPISALSDWWNSATVSRAITPVQNAILGVMEDEDEPDQADPDSRD